MRPFRVADLDPPLFANTELNIDPLLLANYLDPFPFAADNTPYFHPPPLTNNELNVDTFSWARLPLENGELHFDPLFVNALEHELNQPYEWDEECLSGASRDHSFRADGETTLSRIKNLCQKHEHWILLYVNGFRIKVFPDNCFALNVVSESFARKFSKKRVAINRTKTTNIRLPNRDLKQPSGPLQLRFRYFGEKKVFRRMFSVLPSRVFDTVLSGEFLRLTKSFTTYKQRIQRQHFRSKISRRVCLQGFPKHKVIGSINGQSVSASPDTGSDVKVISEEYAELFKLEIKTDISEAETLTFRL
ncbi:hypothetical protein BCR34DRAFT_597820 [Clohesyomyces aquaticus]|uniref:Uncharacterized protein n=1 Tax=Clohesyomyces aquaticus TaxID=1231657 RepID=A0A1Y2A189_9PLEO|nr:hypothetical protein BCR34DRAFT_597820 [Clohesyomyces aquaticus]